MILFAHRGASAYAPENTLAAFELAIKEGCTAVELDIHLTKDKKVVVCHDETVDRTTNGTGKISELTLEEIQSLDAGSWFSKEFIGEKIPTLNEVFEVLPKDTFFNIEIKKESSEDAELEKLLVDYIRNTDRVSNTVISSFNHVSLQKISRLAPEIRIGALIWAEMLNVTNYLKSDNFSVYSAHLKYSTLNPKVIKSLKDNNIKVYPWTVNDANIAKDLIEMGVDGIITNYPNILTQ